ncbi:MAG TPA: flagellar hook-basal body complex protein FliE [Steroidobacteraceae bacterium]|nr:flagellar hook-basal body complex protein FliE [Steroidobacteraceae bacterium]
MSQMEIDRVLAQIRELSAQMRPNPAPAKPAQAGGVSEFASIMRAGVEQVNSQQQRAGQLADAFERGTPGVELPQVMLELQKASVSFRALNEVRNRLVSAYQEIMNLSL